MENQERTRIRKDKENGKREKKRPKRLLLRQV